VAVVQDTRGAYASEGRYVHYNNDDQDGFDTIEWIVQQPWSNGNVGMWGSSHPGAVQWLPAAGRAPGLVAIAPTAAPSSLYHTLYQGGALRLGLTAGAGVVINPPPPGIVAPTDLARFHYHLPLTTLDQAIGWPMPWLKGVVAHSRMNGFWQRLEVSPELNKLDVAAQNIGGYYDLFCGETVENFLRLPRLGKKQLILGPWDHATIGKQVVAGVDFGPEAALDVISENLRWFDRFLKSTKDARPFPAVRYFLMGDNIWRTAADWPPPEGDDPLVLSALRREIEHAFRGWPTDTRWHPSPRSLLTISNPILTSPRHRNLPTPHRPHDPHPGGRLIEAALRTARMCSSIPLRSKARRCPSRARSWRMCGSALMQTMQTGW
jgi:predicted acyl esterase